MSSHPTLTGRWTGHYLQGGNQRPIMADLIQQGSDLRGSMEDGQPDSEVSLFEAAMQAGLPPGGDEAIDAHLRKMIPGAPAGPIRYVTHLPAQSRLEGSCSGRVVSFTKSYLGTSYSGYKVGDKMVGAEHEGHAVCYRGELSRDGLVIEGRWWIDGDPERGTKRAEGLFSLRREPEDA
jgi:hypothetical protein